MEILRKSLRELGWIEGQNVIIVYRTTEGDPGRLPALAADLFRSKVDVIVAPSTPVALAAKSATTSIPIVFSMVSDPVASGLVASLARPGGNVTGWSNILPETSGKLLSLLKELLPTASRVMVLFDANNPGKALDLKEIQAAARELGITVQLVALRTAKDIGAAFASLGRERPDALLTLVDAVTLSNREEIVRLAAASRVPDLYQVRDFAEAGGLLSYGLNFEGQSERTAIYVDRILKGAKPGDLPVEQPTKFELAVNMKTAKVLGLKIPRSILLRAERVIE
ncbi:MAG: ABC transporter substrate-binding protein [Betaproteobacteria bacterium]|nr:ABC transporter substrate-binding protein [Betaproteobacteria bacterium]